MRGKFRIAVIIPVYNREKYIRDALDSVAGQSRLPDEIIVVDDGSTDCSIDVVEDWERSHELPLTLIRQSNGGAAAARNTAIRAAEGNLIAPLDSDDVWLPDHLQVLEQAFREHPDLVVCAGNTRRLDDLPQFKRVAYDEELFNRLDCDDGCNGLRIVRGSAYVSLLKGAYIQTSSCAFLKEAACRVGLFDESLRSFEDQLFFLRMSKCGQFGLYMEPVTLVRKHDDNLTHRRHIASHIICGIAALEKAVGDAETLQLTDAELQAVKGELARKVRGAANRASRYGIGPYWTVCRELTRRGYFRSLFRPKPLLRALIRPRGDRAKLQQGIVAAAN